MPGIAKTVAIGHYSASYEAAALGIIEQPHRWRTPMGGIRVQSDDYGPDTTLDIIQSGQQAMVTLALLEWIASVKNLQNIWDTAQGVLPTAGLLATNNAAALVLTAQAGTTAATNHASRTIPLATPIGEISYDMGVTPRIVAVTFEAVPNSSSQLWIDA